MADDNEQEAERHPYETISERADELGLEGDERDDYITGRMSKAGYKRGTGEWVAVSDDDDDDDSEHDDDGEPMTRGDWRRMQREQRKKKSSYTPPRKPKGNQDGGKKSKGKGDAWW
jgi:hypothetical protein